MQWRNVDFSKEYPGEIGRDEAFFGAVRNAYLESLFEIMRQTMHSAEERGWTIVNGEPESEETVPDLFTGWSCELTMGDGYPETKICLLLHQDYRGFVQFLATVYIDDPGLLSHDLCYTPYWPDEFTSDFFAIPGRAEIEFTLFSNRLEQYWLKVLGEYQDKLSLGKVHQGMGPLHNPRMIGADSVKFDLCLIRALKI